MREASTSGDMTIAVVLGRNGNGGSEGQAKMLVAGLRGRGHSVLVVLVEGDGGTQGFGDARVETLLPHRTRGLRALIEVSRASWKLRRILKAGRYEVVHAIMARAYIIAPLIARTLRDRPRVVAWRRNEGVHVSTRAELLLERMSARTTDVIACNSRSGVDYWAANGVTNKTRVEVIPNALEEWRFLPASRSAGVPSARARVLAVGGLKPVKNHELIIEAVAMLPAEVAPEIVILGEGGHREFLAERARFRGVKLILPGHVSDPRPWMTSSDLYIQSSTSEGLSNALLEAMAQGMAVIASDVGGTREALEHAGVLVAPGDAHHLADEMYRLLLDADRRSVLAREAREVARANCALDSVLDRHEAIYGG